MTEDPAILYTTAAALMAAAFTFLRTLATEREHRVRQLKSIAEAQRAQQEQQPVHR